MANLRFDFCPTTRVAETMAPDEPTIRDMNGWDYTPNPVLPYRRRFKLILEGLRWYTTEHGFLDLVHDREHNAGALENFYAYHRKHIPFEYEHEWLGVLLLRFDGPVNIPRAIPNSGGLVEPLEITAIHHNPSY